MAGHWITIDGHHVLIEDDKNGPAAPHSSEAGKGKPHLSKDEIRQRNVTAFKTPFHLRTPEQRKITGTVGAYGNSNFNWKTWRESRSK